MKRRMYIMLRPVLSGCCMLLFFLTLYAQPKEPVRLQTIVALAVKNYPSIQARQADVDAAAAFVTETKNAWLPSVKLNEQIDAGSDNSLTSAYFPMGIVPSASGGRRPDNVSQVAVGNIGTVFGQWEVYNFGGYAARTQEALAALQAGKAGLGVEQYRIQSAALQYYLDLLKYQSLAAVQMLNIQRTDTIKRAIQAYINSGLRAGVDSSVAEAELSKARLTYLDLLNGLHQVKNQLSALTGLDTAAIIADSSINAVLRPLLSGRMVAGTPAALHPVLNYFNAVYQDQLAKQDVIRKSNLPKIHLLAAGWMRGSSISPDDVYNKNLLSGLSYSRFNYLSGISVTYDLFDLKRTRYRLNEQKYLSQAAYQNFNEQKILLNSSLNEAGINLQTAAGKLKEIPIQQASARAAYEQKLAMYNAGLTNIVDLTNALYLLNRAETDAILATDAAWKALVQQAYASNTINQLLSTLK